MLERKEVMKALVCRARDHVVDCTGCPYNESSVFWKQRCDFHRLCADALALLKEQEARVLTLKELQAIETPWNRNTPPYLFVEERSAAGSRWTRWMSWGIIHDGVRSQGTMGVQNYGTKWRVWNLEPTPEQMRDTPWEGDVDEK